MWVYKDDHTDVRILGAIAKALPEVFGLESVEKFINEKLKSSQKVASARTEFERFATVDVKAGQGNAEELFKFDLPGWKDMRGGVSIKGQPQGGPYADPVSKQAGGFRPVRNELFKKYSTRTERPVVNFSTCTKCTLCWLNCPDASFDVAPDGKWAVGLDARAYIRNEKILPTADIYRVNTSTGERTLVAKGQLTGRHTFGITPQGRHFLFWKDNKIQAYDFEAGTTKALGAGAASFVDLEDDHPGTKPSYGIAGYSSDGKAVIAQHRYDLWLVPFDGSAAKNLTNGVGAKSEIRFRILRPVPADPTLPRSVGPRGTIDLSKPVTLSAYGEWTKKSGYYELAGGQLKELIYEDASFSNPVRAMKADRFLFTRQTFVEFPDLRVSGPSFRGSKKISDANPQQKDFLWGHRLLFDYKNKDGVRLQGILAIPDDYKAGEKRPMLVIFYEKNSQNMHIYSAPAYLPSMGRMPVQAVSDGYLSMLPDIHFRTGSSHTDMLECVEAATRKVIEMGYADPKRIGVSGHSYSGEGAAFIGTMSKMFAAVGMGAGVVDLYNDFSMPWGWGYGYQGGSGDTAFQYYLYDQGRWGFSPWDRPDRYYFESALTHAPNVSAPFLIMHGTADPTVGFINGLAFYNALRYNGKKAVLLAYPNEGHGLRGLANRRDLTIRFFEFFDHYLKGAPAPKWLTEGVPYLKKEAGVS